MIFGIFPILAGLYLSFFRYDGMSMMIFLGLENYINLVKDKLFQKALFNTLFIGIVDNTVILLTGLILAYILNSRLVKFKNIFKTIYFTPMVTSAVAISIVFQILFGYNFGLINAFFSLFGDEPIDWLRGDGSLLKMAIIIMVSWKWIGWNMVQYLAGMQGISGDIYEAATIDGAGHVQIFLRITVPLLKPIILFTIVQSSIGTFSLFTEPFILTNLSYTGGQNHGALALMTYLLDKAPQNGTAYGYASACAYLITIMIVIITFIERGLLEEREPKFKAGKK
jgi:ABC-type sugar transport system permease subunit